MLRSLALASLLATGCYADGTYSGAVYAEPAPNLVEVSPGVQVIADYDYPVFYSDGFYWRYDGGTWYRSHNYRGGWGRSYEVPVRVRGIERPEGYAHFRGTLGARNDRREPVRDHRGRRVRDHR